MKVGITFSLFICLTSPSCFFNLLGTSIIKQSFGELVLSEGKGKQEKLMLKLSWTKYGSSSWEKISTSFWYFLEVGFFPLFFLSMSFMYFSSSLSSRKREIQEKNKSASVAREYKFAGFFFLERYRVSHLQSF